YIVSAKCADRDDVPINVAHVGRYLRKLLRDRSEHFTIKVDKVHLIHNEYHAADSKQPGNVGMTPRLRQNPLACIDEYQRQIGCRCASNHVPSVLIMAWSICNDEASLTCRE